MYYATSVQHSDSTVHNMAPKKKSKKKKGGM